MKTTGGSMTMINNRNNRLNSVVAGTIALAFTCAGLGAGVGFAQAVPVAGRDGVTGVEQSVGTNVLKIRLTKGNPDDDGQTVAGSVEGVTIHLDRLEGIDPKNPADMKRVESASLEEIQKWNKDLNLSKVTDANGEVQFSGLVDGIYLVTSSAPDGNYREINAFLVAVPFHTVTDNPNRIRRVKLHRRQHHRPRLRRHRPRHRRRLRRALLRRRRRMVGLLRRQRLLLRPPNQRRNRSANRRQVQVKASLHRQGHQVLWR